MPAPSGKRFPIGLPYRPSLLCVLAIVLCFSIASSSPAQAADNQQKLESLLRRFPAADANKDGKLTVEEAKAHLAANPELRQKRQADGEGEGTVDAAVLELYEAREFKGVKYRLLKPIDLAKNPDQKYPLILSLHGAAGQGTDNVRNLREWNTVMAQEELRRKHPCFVVVPQSIGPWRTPAMAAHYTDEKIAKMSKDWQEVVNSRRKLLQDPKGGNLDRVFLLLDALAKEFPIDTDRVYVLGHSMGGFGTWTAVAEQPNRFAAAITSAGWLGPWFDANAVKDVPIWSFQGAKDKASQVSLGNATFERMKAIGAKMKFTEVANIGHGVMFPAFSYTGDSEENTGVTKYASDRCDKTADVWDWLFSKKRETK
jgi:predicted peptidase